MIIVRSPPLSMIQTLQRSLWFHRGHQTQTHPLKGALLFLGSSAWSVGSHCNRWGNPDGATGPLATSVPHLAAHEPIENSFGGREMCSSMHLAHFFPPCQWPYTQDCLRKAFASVTYGATKKVEQHPLVDWSSELPWSSTPLKKSAKLWAHLRSQPISVVWMALDFWCHIPSTKLLRFNNASTNGLYLKNWLYQALAGSVQPLKQHDESQSGTLEWRKLKVNSHKSCRYTMMTWFKIATYSYAILIS